jgi:NADH dehydrogenase
MSVKSSNDALEASKQMGITVILNKRVVKHDGTDATLDDGTVIPCKTLVWAAGVTGSMIPGLPAEAIGRGNRVIVNEFNGVKGCTNIYAIGDVALMQSSDVPHGHPQLAPVAMQQGVLLAKNFERLVAKERMQPFKYLDKGTMATIGRNKAVVDLPGNIHLKGFLAWLAWMALHLIQLIGFRSRVIVLINWIWNYITYDRSIRLILKAKK